MLSLLLVTACSGPSRQPAASSGARHPLALAPPPGTSSADVVIAGFQGRLRGHPEKAELWEQLGQAWVRKARESGQPALYRSADDAAQAALELAPGSAVAEELRGLVLLDAHRFEEARRLALGLLDVTPSDVTAMGILADALLELGLIDEAVRVTQRMVDQKPGLPSYVRAAHLQWLQGDVDQALETARLAGDAGAEPEPRAWVLVQAGMMHWHRGELAEAEASATRALDLVPAYPQALVALGRVALSRDDAAAAVRWLETAWRRAPLPETGWLLGDARRALGDRDGADEAYRRVVQDGRTSDPRTLALFLATKNRDVEEALRLAEAERSVRDDLYTEDVCAWALYRAGRFVEAEQAALRATRLGTPDARLLYHLGAIRLARGLPREGRALIERALRLNPAFDPSGAEEARRLVGRGPTASVR